MSSLPVQSAVIDDSDRAERSLRAAAMSSLGCPKGWAQLALYVSGRGQHRRSAAVLWEAKRWDCARRWGASVMPMTTK